MKETANAAAWDLTTQGILNKLSLAAAVITFICLFTINIFKRLMIKRTTLQFQCFIALIDILRHTANFNIHVVNDTTCSVVGGFVSLGDQLYVMLNVLIGVISYFIFIKNSYPKLKGIKLGFLGWLIFVVCLDITLFAMGKFGRNPRGTCNFKIGPDMSSIRILAMYTMLLPGVLLCGVYAVLVLTVFKHRIQKVTLFYRGILLSSKEANAPINYLKNLYWKIALYPFSCFLTLFPFLVYMIIVDSGFYRPYWLSVLSRFCLRLPGLFNFVFMVCDPHFQQACSFFINVLRTPTVNNQEFDDKSTQASNSLEYLNNDHLPSCLTNHHSDNNDWEVQYADGKKLPLGEHIRFC